MAKESDVAKQQGEREMRRPRTIAVGNFERAEMVPIARFLTSDLANHELLEIVPSVAQAIESTNESVDRVLVAPEFREQFPATQIQRLAENFTQAEITLIVGSWLQGETRSGSPSELASRLYVDQLIPRWRQACRQMQSGRHRHRQRDSVDTPPQRHVWTSVGLEAVNADVDITPQAELVAVCSELDTQRELLIEIVEQGGWSAVACHPDALIRSRSVGAVVYDMPRVYERAKGDLQRLSHAFPNAGLIALVAYPRWHEVASMIQAGAQEVVGKPFEISDLLDCVRQVCQRTISRSANATTPCVASNREQRGTKSDPGKQPRRSA